MCATHQHVNTVSPLSEHREQFANWQPHMAQDLFIFRRVKFCICSLNQTSLLLDWAVILSLCYYVIIKKKQQTNRPYCKLHHCRITVIVCCCCLLWQVIGLLIRSNNIKSFPVAVPKSGISYTNDVASAVVIKLGTAWFYILCCNHFI